MILKHRSLCIFLVFAFLGTLLAGAGITAKAKGIPSLWDGTVDTSWYDPNVPQKEYAISSAPQLAGLAQLVNQGNSLEGTTIRLHSDLDLAGHNWIPMGNQLEAEEGKKAAVFSGTFEGNGHIISNLTIGSQSSPYEGSCAGLFGSVNGHISNLSLENASIFFSPKAQGGQAYAASAILCAYLGESGSVDHCLAANSSLSAVSLPTSRLLASGGLVGICYGKISSASVREGSLSDPNGFGTLGGLCGAAGPGSVLKLCSSSGEICGIENAVASFAGGLLGATLGDNGKNAASVQRCCAQGTVTGGTWSGGLIGNASNTVVENCYTTVTVKNAVYVGGFLGIGGDASTSGKISNSYTFGQVSDCFLYGGAFTGSQKESLEKLSGCYYLAPSPAPLPERNAGASAKPSEFFHSEAALILLNHSSDGPWTAGEEYPYCGAERADYSAVEQAAASIPTDLNNYTEKTVASLNQAIDQILYSCTLAEQAEVDSMAQTIEAAAAALVLRPADYMLVEEALAMVPQDLSVYTKESVAALTDAVETVPRGQTVLNQAEVDLAAHAIEQAVIGLIPLEGGTENKFANQPEGEERPETGDFDLLPIFISLLLSAGLLLVGWLAKKKKKARA